MASCSMGSKGVGMVTASSLVVARPDGKGGFRGRFLRAAENAAQNRGAHGVFKRQDFELCDDLPPPVPDRDGKFKDPVGEGHRLDLGELFPVEFLIHRLPAGERIGGQRFGFGKGGELPPGLDQGVVDCGERIFDRRSAL